MNGREQVQAARDCLARARTAEEQLRSAIYEATVWLTLAVDNNDEGNGHEDPGSDGGDGGPDGMYRR